MKLIDKDALVAELERRIKTNKECMLGLRNLDYYQGKVDALNDTISFIDSLQEEPVSDELEKVVEEIVDPTVLNAYGVKDIANRLRRTMIDPVSEDLEQAIDTYLITYWGGEKEKQEWPFLKKMAIHFANWQKEHLLKPADGEDLPIIDREVIAILDNGKVVFAHRPPEYWDGKNIVTGKVTRNYPKTYDKGGWNIPNVKYWLDCKLPKIEED